MVSRKTQFVVDFKGDPSNVYQLIMNWLKVNKYVYKEKYNTKYYQLGDGFWNTAEYFEYYFGENKVVIYSYLKSPKKPYPIDNGGFGHTAAQGVVQRGGTLGGLKLCMEEPGGLLVKGP